MSSITKFIKELTKRTGAVIVSVEPTGSGHIKLRIEGCDQFFIIPRTASDERAVLNAAGDIKRAMRYAAV